MQRQKRDPGWKSRNEDEKKGEEKGSLILPHMLTTVGTSRKVISAHNHQSFAKKQHFCVLVLHGNWCIHFLSFHILAQFSVLDLT